MSTIQAGPDGSATRVDLSYGYDALGNVNATDDPLEDVSRSLGCDRLNRYTDETIYNPNAPTGRTAGRATIRAATSTTANFHLSRP